MHWYNNYYFIINSFKQQLQRLIGSHIIVIANCVSLVYTILIVTGTAAAAMWTLRAEGRLFHSGLPHKV